MRVEKASVKFGIELCSAEDTERDDVEPEEERDAGAEGSIDLSVVGKARDIPTKDEGGKEPRGSGEDSAGHDTLPRLLHWRAHVVDEAYDADAASERDSPADEKSDGVNRSAGGGNEVQRQPLGEELAEDDEEGGEGKGDQRERNE